MAQLVEALRDPDLPDDHSDGVWPGHVGTVLAFLLVATQWRTSTRGGAGVVSVFGGMVAPVRPVWIGLDYTAVEVALRIEKIEITQELWLGLRIMEDAAAAELNRTD